ncbi:MAG: 23S rRNA (guanosine(2251)-2'-O)-methyltransferase RlmB [Thermaerobacter sp.]|jgi:23S rRNA (guanosine2251-2'-O)-methyltransferase|nr:23S rRNA (guanosine(2251)-2'-O)-methyltransferase RlmB [Thermaerobacter sp.]
MEKKPELGDDLLLGRRAVREALRAGRALRRIAAARGAESLAELRGLARESGVVWEEVDRSRLDRLAGGHAHQGVVAWAAARGYVPLEAMLAAARERGEPPLLLALDGVQDPRNLGALLRTAEAAGVHGVIIPQRRSCGLTGAVAKAAAGAEEYVPVSAVVNLVRTLRELEDAGLWAVGADPTGERSYTEVDLCPPTVLVLGGEGKGLSRLVREGCDLLVRIPMRGTLASLNVSVAGALLMYEAVRQRAGTTNP